MNRPAQAKKNNKKLAVIIVALVAILAVIIVSVVVALTSIGKAKDDTSSSDSDFTAGSDGQTDPEPENDDTDDDTAEDDTTDNSSNDSSDDSSDDTSDDTSDELTDDSSDTETEDSSEEPSSEPENEPEEPVGNESGVTSRGYTVSNKNGAYYVTLGSTEILVANKTYELDENYNPGGLTSDTKSAFNELVSAAGDAGHTITNVSGFRSYATQERVYNGWVNTYGTEGADRISARPGHSEHQTGMAIDVNSLDESFGDTDTGKWLASNAHKYGFIIRYPKGKEHITGYSYEPWHIRYVGEIAADIYESGLTLEEYLGITSSY
ncbi:MAG: M15 family metallopeptidase [Clostridia bacterium]|nr:M15 family metallopeptidase [Clostridia bacterium]